MKLFINTCLKEVGIALIDATGELVDKMTWTADRQESKKLVPKIEAMLSQNKLGKNDLDGICLVIGPGSFTAVRIGFIVGRAFALTLGIELKTCNTFEFLSLGLNADSDSYKTAYLEAGGKIKGEGKALYKVDLANGSFEIVGLDGLDNNALKNGKIWSDCNEISDNSESIYKEIGRNWKKIVNGMSLVQEVEDLEPFYVKEPNIT